MAFIEFGGVQRPLNVAFNRLTTHVAYLTGLTNTKIYGGHLIVDDQGMALDVILTPRYRNALAGTDHDEFAQHAALLADMHEFNAFDVTLHHRIVEPVREQLAAAGEAADDRAVVTEIARRWQTNYDEMRPAIIQNTVVMKDAIDSGRFAIDGVHVLPSSLLSELRGQSLVDRFYHWLRTAPSFARKAALKRYREFARAANPAAANLSPL